MKNRLTLLILILIFFGCAKKQELKPIWFLKVSEESKLSKQNNKLYLVNPIKTFEINLQTGEKKVNTTIIRKTKNANISKLNKEKKQNRIELNTGKITYFLVESFSSTVDCQEPQNTYRLERLDVDKNHSLYSLGNYENFHVLDYQVMQNELFIIKNPFTGGDAFFLEKYKLY